MVKLLSEALRALRLNGESQIPEEHPPEYGPQANGAAEVRVAAFRKRHAGWQ